MYITCTHIGIVLANGFSEKTRRGVQGPFLGWDIQESEPGDPCWGGSKSAWGERPPFNDLYMEISDLGHGFFGTGWDMEGLRGNGSPMVSLGELTFMADLSSQILTVEGAL